MVLRSSSRYRRWWRWGGRIASTWRVLSRMATATMRRASDKLTGLPESTGAHRSINGRVSNWYDELPAYRPALPGDRDADVCIVGAGYTGLWTAYYLKRADPSLRIAVLEARFAGFGASGRNGGWLSGLVPGDRNRMAAAARPRRGGGLAAGAERRRRRGDRRRGRAKASTRASSRAAPCRSPATPPRRRGWPPRPTRSSAGRSTASRC